MNKQLQHTSILKRAKLILPVCMLFFLISISKSQDLLNIKGNAVFYINTNANVDINGNLDNESNNFEINGDINISGNWNNDAIQTMPAGSITFDGSGNSTITGTGTTTEFFSIIINKDNATDIVQYLSGDFTVPNGFLSLTQGIFRFSGTFTISNTFFDIANYVINGNVGFWLDNPNAIVTGQASSATLSGGLLRITDGLFEVGTQNNFQHNLLYAGAGSRIIMEGGELNVTSRLSRDGNNNSEIDIDMSGGDINIGTGAVSSEATRGNFDIGATASTFNWSGGNINLNRPSANPNGDYLVLATNGTISGGKLNIDAAVGGQTYQINTNKGIWDFELLANNAPQVQLAVNDLDILNDITLAGAGADRFQLNGFDMNVSGDFINNLGSDQGFDAGTNRVTFNSSSDQNIDGTQNTRFYELAIDKTSGTSLLLNNDNANSITYVENALRLLSDSTYLDLNQRILQLEVSAKVYADNSNDTTLTSFRASNKFILNSDSSVTFDGIFRRRIPQIAVFSGTTSFYFPIGTVSDDMGPINVFEPVDIIFLSDRPLLPSAITGANAYIDISPKGFEHPEVERNDVSLSLHFVIETNDITFNERSITIQGYFDETEVEGNLSGYEILYFAESYTKAANGFWLINPGKANNIIELDDKYFLSEEIDSLDGDWTAGEESAARAIYYSKQDGNYNDPNTWSKTNFGVNDGNTTIPNKQSDVVRIRNNTVTIPSTYTPAPANRITIESATGPDSAGVLIIQGNQSVTGDTLRIEAGATLAIEHTNGIALAPASIGAVQTEVREFNTDAIYRFEGSANQVTGDAVPSPPNGNYVKKIVVDKVPGSTLTLSKSLQINDTLSIFSGSLDLASYTANGNGGGKTLEMFGGELIIQSSFPTNYNPPTFTAGKVRFDGSSSIVIPSSASSPAVNQYYDLEISSASRAGNVVLSGTGEIVINNDFTIDNLNFDVASREFDTQNSTVRFNGGNQTLPFVPNSPADSSVNLTYYNLILDGTGTKTIPTNPNNSIVENNLDIESGVTLELDNSDFEVRGNWTNNGGNFEHNTNAVILRSPDLGFTNFVTSDDTTNNAFYDVLIAGEGDVEPADDMLIENDLIIGDDIILAGNFVLPAAPLTVTLRGDMTINENATFDAGQSEMYFSSPSDQLITNNFDIVEFYDLTIDKSNDSNLEFTSSDGTVGVEILPNGELDFINGNLITSANDNYVKIDETATLTRTNGTGHVDGELQLFVNEGDLSSFVFHVGYQNQYSPATFDFNTSGADDGVAGYLGVKADTINTTSSVISWDTSPPANFTPAASGMSTARHIARQWRVQIPSGSSFDKGDDRRYDATFQFLTSDDFYSASDFTIFEPRFWTGNNWIIPQGVGVPVIGTRTANTTQLTEIDSLGTFFVGEPAQLSFYSIANGDWDDPNTWSLVNYGGPPSASTTPDNAPVEPLVFVGDGYNVNLNVNQTVNDDGNFVGRVQVDSTGVLTLNSNLIQGTGEFRLMSGSTLEVGHPQGIEAAANDGNIRTSIRNYNFNNHNNGNFVFNGTANQNTGDGIPDTIATISIRNNSNDVTLETDIVVLDSLHVEEGTFVAGSSEEIFIIGDLRVDLNQTLDLNGTNNFYFVGDTIQNVTAFNDLAFQNLIINNQNTDSSYINFVATGTTGKNILINNELEFVNNSNAAYIELNSSYDVDGFPNYNQGEWFVTIASSASVSRTGSNNFGHISGELRKTINTGSTDDFFEVGAGYDYTPFRMELIAASGEAVGEIGVHSVPFRHIHSENSDLNAVEVMERYWRVTRPSSSSFNRGTREMASTVIFKNPEDIPPSSTPNCFDLSFWRGNNPNDWQRLRPPSQALNDGSGGVSCSGRGTATNEADYPPRGTDTSTTAYSIDGTIAFANTDLGLAQNNRFLLGDFIVGNQGDPPVTFYSWQNGGWKNPATWSTDSTVYVNADNTIPKLQGDAAVIRFPHTITLDCNIGTGYLYPSGIENSHAALGSVDIQSGGTLDLDTYRIRCFSFNVLDGGKVITGIEEGFSSATNRGNIQNTLTFVTVARDLNFGNHNNTDFEFTADGIGPDIFDNSSGCYQQDENYCAPGPCGSDWDNDDLWIRRVQLVDIDNDQPGNPFDLSGMFYFCDFSTELDAGTSYPITLTRDGSSNATATWRVWMDLNFDGDFNDSGEQLGTVRNNNTNNTFNITIPPSTPTGTTRMRVRLSNTNGSTNPCNNPPGGGGTGNDGEIEDYTIKIINSNDIITQETGGAVPQRIGSMTINTADPSSTVELTNDVEIRNDIIIEEGTLDASSRTIELKGDFVNNSNNDSFVGNQRTVLFSSGANQSITGTATETDFANIEIDKPTGNLIIDQDTIEIENDFIFEVDALVELQDKEIHFIQGSNAPISNNGGFSTTRMILFDSLNPGNIRKTWNSGVSNSFDLPIGITTTNGNEYSPIYVEVNNTVSNPEFEVKLNYASNGHPDKPTEEILKKYWDLSTTNFTADNVLRFEFTNNDYLSANTDEYIPSVYTDASSIWEIDLGTNPFVDETSAPPFFEVTDVPIGLLNGDWSAGVPEVFFDGRIYYSITNGNWDNPLSWSADTIGQHTGTPASYYPGELFDNDVAFIGLNHQIDYNVDSLSVDTLNIRNNGILFFNSQQISGKWKQLVVNRLLNMIDNGSITGANSGNRRDTLNILENLSNTTLANGPQLRTDINNYTVLEFSGSENGSVSGEGVWEDLERIFLNKDNIADELINNSESFSDATVASPSDYLFLPERGTFTHNQTGVEFSLSGGDNPVILGTDANISVLSGTLSSENDIRYKAGSQIVVNGADAILDVGYTLSKNIPSSTLDLQITDGTVQVNTSNPQNTDISRIAFDLSNSGSSLTMDGGSIIIANGTNGASADFRYDALGGLGMTNGAVIQIGDNALTHDTSSPIKLSATVPITRLDVIGDGVSNLNTQFNSATFTISEEWNVSANNTILFNGNTVNLQGDLVNNGTFNGSLPGTLRLTLGNSQNITNNTAPALELYNLILDKSGNVVNLQNTANSNLLIRNSLEFALNNSAYINILDLDNNYVEINNNGLATLLRIGEGHVNGRLRRFFPLGAQDKLFAVGNDDITEYRPAQIEFTSGTGGTAGLVSVRVYDEAHPDTANAGINTDSDIHLYWNIDNSVSGAVLGSNREMTITTTFLNPLDLSEPSVDIANLQHNIFSPAWPAAGSWTENTAESFTTTSITSEENTLFADYIVAEPQGTEFWSYQDGDWDDPNTWSLTGYNTLDPPPAGRWPGIIGGAIPSPNDIVYIGNGRRVIVKSDLRPAVRFVNLEQFSGLPGTLALEGAFGYVEAIAFSMEDSCTVEIQHLNGLERVNNDGAVRMSNSYEFGLGRFVYNRPDGSQVTGAGIPDTIKTLVVDNQSGAGSNNVFMTPQAGAPTFNIVDSLYILNGNFIPDGDRINRINRDAVFLNNGTMDRLKSESNAVWEFAGTTNNIYIGNAKGAEFRDVELEGNGNLFVQRLPSASDSAHFYIDSSLSFNGAKNIVLLDTTSVVITTTDTSAITGAASDRHIWTNIASGFLSRNINSNGSVRKEYIFPVGVDGDYMPATFSATTNTSVTPGYFRVGAAKGTNPTITEAHLRVNQVASDVLTKFWMVDIYNSATTVEGQFTFNYADPRDVFGQDINFEQSAKWTDLREGATGSWETYDGLVNPTTNSFTSLDNVPANDFIGDWTAGIAAAFRRIFYSRQNGLWSDPNSWTFNPSHSGAIYGPGVFPNQAQDSVVIGGNDEITLDGNYTVEGTSVGTTAANIGILNALSNVLEGDYFDLNDQSTLKIGHPDGITSLGNAQGNIQTTVTRNYQATGVTNFEYNGSVDQVTGNGLPASFGELTINNSGADGTVTFQANHILSGDFNINDGRANLDAFTITGTGPQTISIAANAYLRIGSTNNMATAVPDFGTYNLDINSFVEFASTNPDTQDIDELPVNMLPSVSFGNVVLLNNGTKIVDESLLIRGNLFNTSNAILNNDADALSIRGSIINSAEINNTRIIEIGQ